MYISACVRERARRLRRESRAGLDDEYCDRAGEPGCRLSACSQQRNWLFWRVHHAQDELRREPAARLTAPVRREPRRRTDPAAGADPADA
jgi:hypothetical protein